MSSPAGSQTQSEIDKLRLLTEELHVRAEQVTQAILRSQAATDPALAELPPVLQSMNRSLQKLSTRVRAHEKERGQLRALQTVGAAINSSLDLSEVLRVVMDTIIELTGAERSFLMLINEETNNLEVRVARNVDRETIQRSSFDISRSIVRSVAETGEPVVTTNAQSDPRFASQESIISYNLRSILCVPLKRKETTTGVIYADNRIASGIFKEKDRDLLSSFANQAAVAIENARLFEQIRDQLADITEMKNLMGDVFASIASGVISIDTYDRIALINRAAERILGMQAQQVLNQPYGQALERVEGFSNMVERVKNNGGQYNMELDTAVRSRRGVTTLNLTFSPLRDIRENLRGVTVVLDDVSEKKRLESVRRYLPPALVDQVRNFEAAQRPQRRRMTVLFADIRGYSTFSEDMAPEQLIQILNGYFAIAAGAISHFEGIIDKYLGDAIMAEFNTTLNPQVDHVDRATRTALMMREHLVDYHKDLQENRRMHFGIGIHVGEAVVGNVGTHFRKDYSVIGDAVNLAKRLQEIAGPGQIVISESVYETVKSWAEVRSLGTQQVKGRRAEEELFELLGVKR